MPLSRLCSLLTAVVILSHAAAAGLGHAQATQPLSREARWQEDLTLFANEFAARQKDFAKLYPKKHFEKTIANLKTLAATSSDADMLFELMRLVASANVAHTTVNMSGQFRLRRLPLGLGWYSDGLAVVGASEAYRAALGTQVVRIGTMTPQQLEAAVAPYIAHENEYWLHQQSPRYMTMLEMLQRVGAHTGSDRVPVTLARPGESPFVLEVAAADPGASVPLSSMFDALPIPAALYRKQLQRNYWFEYLPASRALYLQYNRCQEDPALPFNDFATRLFGAADASPADRLVIDLRLNAGGDSRVINPLYAGLRSRPSLRARGRLLVLIGRSTFSSGLMAAIALKNDFRAVLVGEPTGEKPNSYGEVLQITLPHSRLTVSYTTKFFRLAPNGDPLALFPDVPVPRSLDDALAGRDPVLDAALRYRSPGSM
jgi:hypothetical protein